MEDLCQKWTQTFTEQTGIQATYVRLSSGETVARLDSAKNSPEFDVWHGGPVDGYGTAATKGLIEAYESPSAAKIPDKYKDTDHKWTGVYVGVLGFCSNKTVLKKLGAEAPKSWDDLLNPAFKGQVSTAHPSTSGTAFTTLWTPECPPGRTGPSPGLHEEAAQQCSAVHQVRHCARTDRGPR